MSLIRIIGLSALILNIFCLWTVECYKKGLGIADIITFLLFG